jgi:HlyD family secretion protein
LARLVGELGSVEANAARARGRISEIELQIMAIDETARNDAQRELRTLEARLAELNERRIAAEDKLRQTAIRSPISGTVNQLNVTTLGGVVTPAEPIATIVPDNALLTVEFRVRPTDVDQIGVGQPAKLKLTAFNQRTTPEVDGVVTKVSAAAQQDSATGESFYMAEVSLKDQSQLGELTLVPGMPVEAFVQTDEMTAIAYLLRPFTDQIARAFREE